MIAGSDGKLRLIECAEVLVARDVRDPLRTAVRLELSSGAEDLDSGLGCNNAEAAIYSRARVEDAARLLDDLGWFDDDARQVFRITMPAHRLIALLKRLDQTTTRALQGYARMLRSTAWV